MPDWIERLASATSQWAEDLAALIENVTEEETAEDQDVVIKRLREEYGEKLLAKDAEIEGLQNQVRGLTRVLQMCYQAHDTLYDALYVSGKREMG